jgi:signal transduction histidine kinase
VIVLSDVSAAERQEQAEREFVTNAAHELRTPLQTILGAVEMLQAGAKDSPDERDMFLGHIERESTRLSRLVQALLVLARAQTLQESPRLQPVELRGLLEDVAAGSRPRPGVALEVDCPPGVIALTHRDLLEQALANLASNAAKHTRSGAIRLRARETTQGIVAEVEDTGTGIAAEQRRRVAERFYRGERRGGGGFGLGLAIATQAVQAVGGSLDVQSERGRGTTVRIVLPAAAERVA